MSGANGYCRLPSTQTIETDADRYLAGRRDALDRELSAVGQLAEAGGLQDVEIADGDIKITPLRAVTPPEAAALRDQAYGPGSVIQSVTSEFRRPIAIDEPVTATVTVTEVRKSMATVQIDCRCTDEAGAVLADARVEVGAPTAKIRKQRPKHELDELLDRCKDIKPIATGVVYPCSADALLGAAEASANGLIDAVLFGPEATIRKLAAKNKVDLAKCRIVATADPEEAAAKAAAAAGAGDGGLTPSRKR